MDPLKLLDRDPTERLVRQLQTLSHRVSSLETENKALKRALYDLSAAYARAGGGRGNRRFIMNPEESSLDATAEEVDEVSEDAVAHAGHGNEREKRDPRLFYPKYELRGHSGAVYTVKYAADGRLLASGSFDRTIRIWDGPHEVLCLRKHTLPVTQLLWSSEDHTSASILSASLDRTCRLWDVRAGKMREVYDTQGIPQSIAFNHRDPHIFAYGGSKGAISVVDTRQKGHGTKTWENPTGSVNALHFCRDGYGLLTGDAQGRVSLWDTRTGRWVKSMETDYHQGTPICHMSILHGHHANDPDHVAITGFDDLLALYQGSCDLEGQLGLRPLHPLLPSGGYRNRCWPIQSTFFEGRDCKSFPLSISLTLLFREEEEEEGASTRFRHLEPQKSLDTSLLLATGSSLPHVYLYDVGGVEGSMRVLQRLEGHRDRVYTVDFSPREPLLASGSADMSIRLWSPAQRARHKVDGEI
ncbi:MAG: WD40-repeat-containing domain protein [Piptocephalis tieghemiana]|nr:MAG: WD40-repeat-containing domain protein [Piptocephalis tieghemiana]